MGRKVHILYTMYIQQQLLFDLNIQKQILSTKVMIILQFSIVIHHSSLWNDRNLNFTWTLPEIRVNFFKENNIYWFVNSFKTRGMSKDLKLDAIFSPSKLHSLACSTSDKIWLSISITFDHQLFHQNKLRKVHLFFNEFNVPSSQPFKYDNSICKSICQSI